jgi:hypothetical protein
MAILSHGGPVVPLHDVVGRAIGQPDEQDIIHDVLKY